MSKCIFEYLYYYYNFTEDMKISQHSITHIDRSAVLNLVVNHDIRMISLADNWVYCSCSGPYHGWTSESMSHVGHPLVRSANFIQTKESGENIILFDAHTHYAAFSQKVNP